jgi:hypothetical protein
MGGKVGSNYVSDIIVGEKFKGGFFPAEFLVKLPHFPSVSFPF